MPTVLSIKDTCLESKISYLIETFKLNDNEVKLVLKNVPHILIQSKTDNLIPKINYFISELKIPNYKLKSSILRYPKILKFSLVNSIKPKISYLHVIKNKNYIN